ncbi:MAG: GNAT family N-acetyltransferase [Muribaculaceae bacterium]|nr:GNAT family N-acetyltransferase [Muribaculaceae bacterium]
MEIKVREAQASDCHLIGEVVAMGIGHEVAREYTGIDEVINVLSEVSSTCGTQYSYRNALIAEVDGEPAGAIVGYDGARLRELRDGSLAVIRKYHPGIKVVDDETGEGEFYLDSVAVLPRFRGAGVGRRLIDAMSHRAAQQGHTRVGLLVDFENPRAEKLYETLGFRHVGERPFFGHLMKHMQLSVDPYC